MLQTICWTGNSVRLLDQTRLPAVTEYVEITSEKQMHDAILRSGSLPPRLMRESLFGEA